jgi:hypothetical protein
MEEIKEKIRSVFEKADHQLEALAGIYKLFLPDFNEAAETHGWPSCGFSLYWFIANHFKKFDFNNHPNTLPGHLWLIKGFSENDNLEPWEIDLSTCEIRESKESCFA